MFLFIPMFIDFCLIWFPIKYSYYPFDLIKYCHYLFLQSLIPSEPFLLLFISPVLLHPLVERGAEGFVGILKKISQSNFSELWYSCIVILSYSSVAILKQTEVGADWFVRILEISEGDRSDKVTSVVLQDNFMLCWQICVDFCTKTEN